MAIGYVKQALCLAMFEPGHAMPGYGCYKACRGVDLKKFEGRSISQLSEYVKKTVKEVLVQEYRAQNGTNYGRIANMLAVSGENVQVFGEGSEAVKIAQIGRLVDAKFKVVDATIDEQSIFSVGETPSPGPGHKGHFFIICVSPHIKEGKLEHLVIQEVFNILEVDPRMNDCFRGTASCVAACAACCFGHPCCFPCAASAADHATHCVTTTYCSYQSMKAAAAYEKLIAVQPKAD